jgi:hypothetical protein
LTISTFDRELSPLRNAGSIHIAANPNEGKLALSDAGALQTDYFAKGWRDLLPRF